MLTEQSQNIFQIAFQKLMPLFSQNSQALDVRRQFLKHFDKLGVPSNRLDDWKYSDFSSYPFHILQPAVGRKETLPEEIKSFLTSDPSHRWLFVNNHALNEFNSRLFAIENLADMNEPLPANFRNGFQALNYAFYQDGARLVLPSQAIIQEPIILIHFTISDAEPLMVHPRNSIIAGENSKATIIELYLNNGHEISFTNTISHLTIKEGACINHIVLQSGVSENLQVSHFTVQQAANSQYIGSVITAGTGINRTTIDIELNGTNAECQFHALAMLKEKQKTDIALSVKHNKPACKSRIISRSVGNGKSKNSFTGKIIVAENASNTQANLESKNLLLSADAEINTRPQLEIYNDDVQCSHGATVGSLDSEALFYLRSRGVEEKEAVELLIKAFIHPCLQGLPTNALKYVENLIHEH